MARSYSDEEVEAILRRALEQQAASGDGFERDELLAAAREVGLEDGALDRAIEEIEGEREHADLRARMVKRAREAWLRHLTTFLIVMGGLVGMHVLGYIGAWVAWVAFGWGVTIALETFRAFRGPSDEAVEKERTKLNRKARRAALAQARLQERRAAKRRRAGRARRQGEVGDELERVVEEGVAMLLNAAANKLREATQPKPAPDTDFARYVAHQKSGRTEEGHPGAVGEPSRAGASPVHARVEVDDGEATPEAVESETTAHHEHTRQRNRS